ncbi:hypothetical protein HPB51_015586 [Rhipicephalus microplus]|uniref:CCHC-type domain-containing protein n=1 Tax=Rhipicephalus microplus TaxID=6941 RepID=A0A9J6DHI9_RHIMP|nr:hypothetical protein HPB51_015586 [Rhipicephalus microplus]
MNVSIADICQNTRMGRECALLGNYESAIVYYQGVIQQIHRLVQTVTGDRKERWQQLGSGAVCTAAPSRLIDRGPPLSPTQNSRFPTFSHNPTECRTAHNRPICFNCRRIGHIVRYCNSRRNARMPLAVKVCNAIVVGPFSAAQSQFVIQQELAQEYEYIKDIQVVLTGFRSDSHLERIPTSRINYEDDLEPDSWFTPRDPEVWPAPNPVEHK